MALGDVTLARDAVERPWITPRCATKVIPRQHRMCAAGRHAEKSFETTKQATFGKGHLNRKGQLNTSVELTYIEKESMNSNSGHTQCKASMRARARVVLISMRARRRRRRRRRRPPTKATTGTTTVAYAPPKVLGQTASAPSTGVGPRP